VYRADFLASAAAPEVEGDHSTQPFVLYPEWDAKKKALRPDHCKVYLEQGDREDSGYLSQTLSLHRPTLQRLRKNLMRFRNMRQVLRRQTDGEFPDVDALIDAYAQRRSGHTDDDRVYLSRRLFRRDLAVSILMDVSLSTDAYTGGQRVLDVEKQAVLMFGQLLQEQEEAFRVDAFWSKTRNQCHYVQLKDFRDGWTTASARIGGLRPVGYTRIGPALRHATALLRGQSARRRWILLLSDGKPNDYDRYEGHHGIADVRQAIREAEQAGVRVYALAVEQEARHYLPQMLGHANYQILARPEQLPEAMLFFYTRLLAS
jgi:nitric oxide reductase NorD protein